MPHLLKLLDHALENIKIVRLKKIQKQVGMLKMMLPSQKTLLFFSLAAMSANIKKGSVFLGLYGLAS
jgi:hypothetical protein